MEMADRCYIFCRYAGLHHNFGSKGHRQDVILWSWRLGSDTNDMQIGRPKTTTDLPALCQSICILSPLFFAAFMFRLVQFFFTGQEKKIQNTVYRKIEKGLLEYGGKIQVYCWGSVSILLCLPGLRVMYASGARASRGFTLQTHLYTFIFPSFTYMDCMVKIDVWQLDISYNLELMLCVVTAIKCFANQLL